ncbi:Receptor protein kinase-like protein [Quillaja saponaria]|uniref:Receptor protein kinase-like protein n=1 Tax=Quillaja saponaria TaxID=32244 RepID=A0AAD7L1C4_QUISA|nr:Receptor protein kinase-like protein [Quillaja saponaria]
MEVVWSRRQKRLVLQVPKSSVLIERNKLFSNSNRDLPLHYIFISGKPVIGKTIVPLWQSEVDCYRWKGISCNNQTGNVITLNLSSDYYRGNIDLSVLCELQYLEYLHFSFNNLEGQRIPKCIGSLGHLIDLILYGFVGSIPSELQNLSCLQTLDLYWNQNLIAKGPAMAFSSFLFEVPLHVTC